MQLSNQQKQCGSQGAHRRLGEDGLVVPDSAGPYRVRINERTSSTSSTSTSGGGDGGSSSGSSSSDGNSGSSASDSSSIREEIIRKPEAWAAPNSPIVGVGLSGTLNTAHLPPARPLGQRICRSVHPPHASSKPLRMACTAKAERSCVVGIQKNAGQLRRRVL